MKLKFAGLEIKELFWRACGATNEFEFKEHMGKLKDIDEDAYNWLMAKPLYQWAKHAFSIGSKSGELTNNMCELFKSWINKFRHKPIIKLLDNIWLKLIVKCRSDMQLQLLGKAKSLNQQRRDLIN